MTEDEYLKTIKYNGIDVKVGTDDYGQQYFFEYTDEKGEFHEVGCGAYNTDYMGVIEMELGEPGKNCEKYIEGKAEVCKDPIYMFCHKCPKNYLIIRRNERIKKYEHLDPR